MIGRFALWIAVLWIFALPFISLLWTGALVLVLFIGLTVHYRQRTLPREAQTMSTPTLYARCPYCGRIIALTKYGKLYRHNTRSGFWCARSGARPQ
jgi:hypothetical protein